ncbi:MAG: SCO family protein, partial [Anaerolineae bacterium]|nr:SCO family protein [Anaerolineae bacterium]
KKAIQVSLIVFLAVAAIYVGVNISEQFYTFKGSVIEPSLAAADFSLTQANGEIFSLSGQRGKVVVMFFGYSYCPDVCPTTLADFKRIAENLGDDSKQVVFVFITVDPERDTVEQVKNYVAGFGSDISGLSGSLDVLQPIWDAYYVFREKIDQVSANSYLMNHTTRIIVVDKQGRFRMTFPSGLGVDAMTEDLKHLINE